MGGKCLYLFFSGEVESQESLPLWFLSPTVPLCSEDNSSWVMFITVVQWCVFWPALVFDISKTLTMWNPMQWMNSQQEPKILAINGGRQEPVLPLCQTERRCFCVFNSQLSLSLSAIFLPSSVYHLLRCHQRLWLTIVGSTSNEVLFNSSCLHDQLICCDSVFSASMNKTEDREFLSTVC